MRWSHGRLDRVSHAELASYSCSLVDAIVRRRRSWRRAARSLRPRPRRASWRSQCGVRAKTELEEGNTELEEGELVEEGELTGPAEESSTELEAETEEGELEESELAGQRSWRPLSLIFWPPFS